MLSRDDVLCALRDHPEAEVGHVTRSLAYANFVGQNLNMYFVAIHSFNLTY